MKAEDPLQPHIVAVMVKLITAAFSDDDFTAASRHATFGPGTSEGIVMCISVAVFVDGLVESDEEFSITFEVVTNGSSISSGNDVTAVTLTDSEGLCRKLLLYTIHS